MATVGPSPQGTASHPDSSSAALPPVDAALTGSTYRITPVTSRIVRLEYSPSGQFEDRPSTFAINRSLRLDANAYEVGEYQGRLTLTTEHFRLEYDRGPFSTNGLKVEVRGDVSAYHSVWRYGQDLSLPADQQRRLEGKKPRGLDGNLGGAARTLDVADGEISLEPGVTSALGYAVIDDSGSMVFENGSLAARGASPETLDLYMFAGGHGHADTMQDFYALAGPQPLLPKYALGNWWSRYHRYSEAEYLHLMDDFEREELPFSVSVIDMDWHVTDVDPQYGSGWTGYTWNRELFPDPERFLAELHRRGLRVTLNVHPADGVRAFEDVYEEMCSALGLPADGSAIPFDVNNEAFMDAYFDVLHRRLEEQGTDFWWIDWQSGPYSSVEGVDPLWVLNHRHFEASARALDRPLTFSRYAGPGSHRYPVGFSGDSFITWDSLAFQPRFTASAANIGYGWWSHDIGGHMEGYRDDELTTRWVQFGVFSPIMRLHSSNSPFSGKEPWRFPAPHGQVQAAHLRLRHRLLPYLHAMNYRAHHEGRPIVEPTYYLGVDDQGYRDQYLFGSELLVAPIIRPAHRDVAMASADVYLPPGDWIDIFAGARYSGGNGGGCVQRMFRGIESVPVLLRAGGVLPLAPRGEAMAHVDSNPQELEVLVAAGAPGSFTLHEEWVNETAGERTLEWSHVQISVDPEACDLRIEIPADTPAAARAALEARVWRVRLLGFDPKGFAEVSAEGADARLAKGSGTGEARPTVIPVSAADSVGSFGVEVQVSGLRAGTPGIVRSAGLGTSGASVEAERTARLGRLTALLNAAHVGYRLKEKVFAIATERPDGLLREISAIGRAPMGHLPELFDYELPSPEFVAAVAEVWG